MKARQEQEDGQFAQLSWPKKKQKNNNNSAMVNTTLGQTQCRDIECINKQDDANMSKKTTDRMKWIEATLMLVSKHKEWCETDKWLLILAIAPGTNPNCLDCLL